MYDMVALYISYMCATYALTGTRTLHPKEKDTCTSWYTGTLTRYSRAGVREVHDDPQVGASAGATSVP